VTFEFRGWETLTDGDIDLHVERCEPADPAKGDTPCYHFRISRHGSTVPVGAIRLRIGRVEDHPVLLFSGHIGYEIDESSRGHGYAGRACRLVRPVALAHGLDRLVITCSPTNAPSRRTLERLGARFVGVYELTPDHPVYREDRRAVCRFEWDLSGSD
jgi:predicted acetyltransferase